MCSNKEFYLAVFHWNRRKNWKNFLRLYRTFGPSWFGYRVWCIFKNTITLRYYFLEKDVQENKIKIRG